MNTSQLKTQIHLLIDSINDKDVLNAILILLKESTKSNVVQEPQVAYGFSANLKSISKNKVIKSDYTIKGNAMSAVEFKKKIKNAESRIDEGRFVSQKDLEKEMKKW